jgi:hypothetical protein
VAESDQDKPRPPEFAFQKAMANMLANQQKLTRWLDSSAAVRAAALRSIGSQSAAMSLGKVLADSAALRALGTRPDFVRRLVGTAIKLHGYQQQWAAQLHSPAMRAFLAQLREAERLSLQFPIVMSDVGWPPPPDASMALIRKAVDLHTASGRSAATEIEQLVLNHYDEEAVRAIAADWSTRLPCRRRHHILREAVEAHVDGRYYCSVAVLLAQCEGLIADGTGHLGTLSQRNYQRKVEALFAAGSISALQDAIDNAVTAFFTSQILVPFEHGKPIQSQLSRHAILHGADVEYGTPAGSLKAILLFDYFQAPFELAGLPKGGVFHTDECPSLRRTTGRMVFYRSHADALADQKRPCSICKP